MSAAATVATANVTARKCAAQSCTTLLFGYRSDATTCCAACRQAHKRANSAPSCTLTAPRVTSTTDLGDGSYRIGFEDGRTVSVSATVPALARTRARWSLATTFDRDARTPGSVQTVAAE